MDASRLAQALRRFKEGAIEHEPPSNAVTLWRAICCGIELVAAELEECDEEMTG